MIDCGKIKMKVLCQVVVVFLMSLPLCKANIQGCQRLIREEENIMICQPYEKMCEVVITTMPEEVQRLDITSWWPTCSLFVGRKVKNMMVVLVAATNCKNILVGDDIMVTMMNGEKPCVVSFPIFP